MTQFEFNEGYDGLWRAIFLVLFPILKTREERKYRYKADFIEKYCSFNRAALY